MQKHFENLLLHKQSTVPHTTITQWHTQQIWTVFVLFLLSVSWSAAEGRKLGGKK